VRKRFITKIIGQAVWKERKVRIHLDEQEFV